MYFGDKVALENLRNHSVCVKVDNGIRNITSEYDIITGSLVYIDNLPELDNPPLGIIDKGRMVRYKPVVLILR